ncbi:MAG TPA: dTDP-4-dehydrorhamnose reductase [Chloroflexota bacterium]|jgi:dTDP-4-dehydrorhamnose reductase
MRVAVVGARGQVGRALVAAFEDAVPLTRDDFDLGDRDGALRAIERARPDLVVNAAAYVDVNGAERDPLGAFTSNALGARWVAQAAERVGAGVLYFSSDYVFAGDGGAPYLEWAEPRPLSVYGRSKRAGEIETLGAARRAWVVRTSWIFGDDRRGFVGAIRRAAAQGRELPVVSDEVGGPTYAADLVAAVRRLVERDAPGLYHLANEGECSRFEWARAIVELTGSSSTVRPITSLEFGRTNPGQAPRPAHSTLANCAAGALGVRLRTWREALAEHLCAPR